MFGCSDKIFVAGKHFLNLYPYDQQLKQEAGKRL